MPQDPNPVTVKITTEGDTSGAKDVEDSIKKIDSAAEEANESQTEGAAGLEARIGGLVEKYKGAALAIAVVYKTMTTSFGLVKDQYDQLAADDPRFAEKNRAMGAALATLSNPAQVAKEAWNDATGAILAGIDKTLLGGALASIKSAVASSEMAKKMKAAYELAAAAHKEMKEGMERDNVAGLLRYQSDQAKILVDTLKNAETVAASQRALDTSKAQAAGATPAEIATQAVQDVAAQGSSALDIAKAAVAEANRLVAEASARESEVLRDHSKEADAVRAKADEARTNAVLAENKLATLQSTVVNDVEKAGVDAISQAQSALGEAERKYQAALLAEVERRGGQASPNAKAAIDAFEKIFADGVVNEQDFAQLAEAHTRGRLSVEGTNAEVKAALELAAANQQSFANALAEIKRVLNNIREQMKGINF